MIEIKGKLSYDGEFLIIETEKAVLGSFNKKQHIVKIEPAALTSIHMVCGILQDEILIYPKSQELIDAMPGEHLGHVLLKTWIIRRSEAKRLVESIQSVL